MKKLIAANWKMNMTMAKAKDFVSQLEADIAKDSSLLERCEILICASYVYISALSTQFDKNIVMFGAQDCSAHEQGTYTGEVSAGMLKDVGCSHVIVGHSDRRKNHGEDDALVQEKARAAHRHNLTAIICVGESREERDAGLQDAVIKRQVLDSVPEDARADNTVIAYEPIWAISSGKAPSTEILTPAGAEKIHGFIRSLLVEHFKGGDKIRILYGGSMNPDNARDLLCARHVDGGLIGGAGLKADSFFAIAQSS
ncbi:MAG: triose-phosphate isomerase [Alphaproteobacteria bacterium]